ncbi:MAG TPA: MobF family relaxase [Acidimicrobiales bacterium]|nr:MobF family relaxase [Acidimicrobiales bacterium]
MLSIARVRAGGEGYYFRTVAATTDLPRGLVEADPYWLGGSAEALGLNSGQPVDGSSALRQLRAVARGAAPGTGEQLVDRARYPVTNVALDVVLSVPKSVSILHALGPPEGSARVERAHGAAVAATVGYLGEAAASSRRQRGDERWEVGVEGLAALCFLHRTSRAADPHLHTHVLVANLALGEDGRWGALDARSLFAHQRVVRALFEAHLRHELSACGVEFGPMRGDFAEVKGISPEALSAFSVQSARIRAYVEARGLSGPAARAAVEAAASELRPEKDRERPYEELRAEWSERGLRLGLSPARLERAAGLGSPAGHRAPARAPEGCLPDPVEVLGRLRTARDGTFSAGDVAIALCSSAPEGAAIADVRAAVAAAIERPEVVRAGSGDRLTTRSHLQAAESAARRLEVLAGDTGARVLAYAPASRLDGLHALSVLQPVEPGGEVIALTLGAPAARRLEAACGHEALPVRQADRLAGRLGRGDVLVLADAGSWLAVELEAAFERARAAGAAVVVFGAENSLGEALALGRVVSSAQRITPQPLGEMLPRAPRAAVAVALGDAPPLHLRLAPDVATACREAAAVARALAGSGREPLVVVPDRSMVVGTQRELAGAAAPVRVVESHVARSEGSLPARAPVVVVGGTRELGRAGGRQEGVERWHVMVAPGLASDDPSARRRARERAIGAIRDQPHADHGLRLGDEVRRRERDLGLGR